MFYVYLARCNNNSLYTGYCSDVEKRQKAHNEDKGALYTKQRRPINIVYYEEYSNEIDAIRREKQIKKWTRIKKENLVVYGHPNGPQ